MFAFYCEWCGQIKEGKEPDRGPEYEKDLHELSMVDFLAKYHSDPTPHYICAECLRRVLKGEGRDA